MSLERQAVRAPAACPCSRARWKCSTPSQRSASDGSSRRTDVRRPSACGDTESPPACAATHGRTSSDDRRWMGVQTKRIRVETPESLRRAPPSLGPARLDDRPYHAARHRDAVQRRGCAAESSAAPSWCARGRRCDRRASTGRRRRSVMTQHRRESADRRDDFALELWDLRPAQLAVRMIHQDDVRDAQRRRRRRCSSRTRVTHQDVVSHRTRWIRRARRVSRTTARLRAPRVGEACQRAAARQRLVVRVREDHEYGATRERPASAELRQPRRASRIRR